MGLKGSILASAFAFATATTAFAQNSDDTAISRILDTARSGSAAKTKYVVDGLVVGNALNTEGAAYREYKCSPSEQFEGLTWCQRWRSDRARRGSFTATYSVLHARDGTIVYVNRHQEPSFLDRAEADKEIQEYSRRLGEQARIMKAPPRAGVSNGIVALWGGATLEPLDPDSMKVVAEGRSPKKGLLVDFLGNFTRSAKEGLPVYRISGGAGFLWATAFEVGGRGALRFAAVDASALPSASAPPSQPPVTAQAPLLAAGATEPVLLPTQVATVEAPEAAAPEPVQPVEATTADLSRAELEAMIAQLQAEKAALEATNRTWTVAGLGAILGSVVLMVLLVPGSFMRSRKRAKREQGDAAPAQAGKPGKIDEGNLIHQLAETLGVDEATALPELAAVPAQSLVPSDPVSAGPAEVVPVKSAQADASPKEAVVAAVGEPKTAEPKAASGVAPAGAPENQAA
jgi:hypothetical protein